MARTINGGSARRAGAGLCAAVAMLVLSACTDLGAVRDWATASVQATQFAEVVETYAGAPKRMARYDRANPSNAGRWARLAETRAAQAKALQLQLDLVADYMATLAVLADDGTATYTADVAELTKSLKETGQLNNDTVAAFGSIATGLQNAALGLWQRREIGRLIGLANEPLQAVLSGELRTIVDTQFRRDLKAEAARVDVFYSDLLRDAEASAAAKVAVEEWLTLRLAENESRQRAVDAYVKLLDRMAAGHQALFERRNDLDAKDLARDLFGYAKDIRDGVSDLVKS